MRRPYPRAYLNDLVEGVGEEYPHAYHKQYKEVPTISLGRYYQVLLGRYYQKLLGIVGERMGEEGGEE